MKNLKFSPSIIAVVLSSVLAGGSAYAADPADEHTSMMATDVENAAERTGDKLDNAADKAGNAIENTANKAGNAVENTADKAGNLAERTGDKAERAAEKTGDFMDDSLITTKVKAELLDHDAIDSEDISVETEKGVVTLSGFVASQEQIKHAVTETGKVAGVVSVNDKLNVTDNADQSLKEYADDAMVTSAVKAKFLADDVVPGLSVSVETQDGVVQLTGEVENQAQATQAENVAKGVDGVVSVKNDLTIKQS
ncbi:molecular chaperone OsmY [Oceanisphaera profunda]|nr:molecular chaperone OsmY [Oceanisphaera profunda]